MGLFCRHMEFSIGYNCVLSTIELEIKAFAISQFYHLQCQFDRMASTFSSFTKLIYRGCREAALEIFTKFFEIIKTGFTLHNKWSVNTFNTRKFRHNQPFKITYEGQQLHRIPRYKCSLSSHSLLVMIMVCATHTGT